MVRSLAKVAYLDATRNRRQVRFSKFYGCGSPLSVLHSPRGLTPAIDEVTLFAHWRFASPEKLKRV